MRIAILTLPPRENYGGILQCYGLQTVLERMGHEVEIIDEPYKINHVPFIQMVLRIGKRLVLKYLFLKECHIFIERDMERLRPIIRQHLERFMNQYLHRKVYNTVYDINPNDYDAIVVGSDQIWRTKYYHSISNAFLDFAEGWKVKRIAYAASFGLDTWKYTQEETKVCAKAIQLFDMVSVREESAVGLCKQYLQKEAKWVVDPTMLLQRSDYEKLIDDYQTPLSKGDLFCYILDGSVEKNILVEKIAKEKHLKPFAMTEINGDVKSNVEGLVKQPVESWLRAFRDAKFIVTDSFHACVFCIIFSKPFVVVGNADRGMTRFNSLLKKFDLQKHILLSPKDYLSGADYNLPVSVTNRLLEESKADFKFLNDCLNS